MLSLRWLRLSEAFRDMSTLLFILALFSFICGLSFILGGFLGMLDFDTPQSARGHLFRIADLIVTSGLIWFLGRNESR